MGESETQALLARAGEAKRAGRAAEAGALFRKVLEAGEHPQALNALGMQALQARDWAEAAALFRRAIAADGQAPELWLNLARAHREAGDDAGEQAALEGALAIDARHFMAVVRMAELYERTGLPARAAERWSGVLAMAAQIDQRGPALDAIVAHARGFIASHTATLADALEAELADARGGLDRGALRRFDACVDNFLGRRQIFHNVCAGLHFPFLPADEYFDRPHFPWLPEIEARTDAIRGELQALLADGGARFRPYVAMPAGTPQNKWSPLDQRLDWGAFHLWKNGVRDDDACAAAPLTTAAVEALPLARIPGRAPTVFFSLLQPGARLPPHTGVSNVRAIIHLPLIVPPSCGFRVGGETRQWREGEAWAFDDTIEHEAWNGSDRVRAILIFDVWNPYIAEAERGLLRTFFAAADRNGYDPRAQVGEG